MFKGLIRLSAVLILLFPLGLLFVLLTKSPHLPQLLWTLYSEQKDPPQLFNINDPQLTYTITATADSGNYVIIPSVPGLADKDHPAYVSESPIPLEPILGKKVKIKGRFVWTNKVMRRPSYQLSDQSEDGQVAAVALTSVVLVTY